MPTFANSPLSMPRKHPPSTVDAALSKLQEADRSEFLEFCRFKPSYFDMQKRLQELGHQVSASAIARWYSATFPKGDQAIALNTLMSSFVGIDSKDAISMSLGVSTHLVDRLSNLIESADLTALEGSTLLHTIGILIKEQRVAAEKLSSLTTIRSSQALELAGGYRLAEIVRNIAKDTPHENLIADCLEGAILQLEEEVKK
jgi:hypothetical protein